ADVVAGRADVAAVTAASVMTELKAGRVRLLAISAPTRLTDPFAETPTWTEQSVDCVVGAWRGVTGPASLGSAPVAFWENIFRAARREPVWQAELARHAGAPMYQDGGGLRGSLEQGRGGFPSGLGWLGLFGPPRRGAAP